MIFSKKTKNVKDLKDLKETLKYVKKLEDRIDKLEAIIDQNKEKSLEHFTKFSVSRFNPFNDMGGDQSFTIALLNSRNNGFILTSLYRRDEAKVFTKPINNGISKYQLLKEEEITLKKAIDHE